jgi:hypothetical protein
MVLEACGEDVDGRTESCPKEVENFLKIVVAFPSVQAGNEGEALLRVADELCAELGYAGGEEQIHGAGSPLSGSDGGGMPGVLSPDDESLVAAMRQGLAKVAAAVGAAKLEGIPQRAVGAALNGAEMVMRGELVSGNAEQLPSLMPSFVFLVALPIVDQSEALDLARRTSELIEGALSS